jgi:LmbE family N-acetylglucosaminyl deacetylase
MKKILSFLCGFCIAALSVAQQKPLNIIVFGAHPDDCDETTGGSAILWSQLGYHVKFVSVTNGDAGHQELGGGALAKVRMAEAEEAKKRFGIAEYEVLDNHDGELMPSLEIRLQIIRRIRQWNADVVITPRPNDYHPDHRYTGILVQDASYMVIVPNVAPDTPPLRKNPVFLYAQDHFQKPNPFSPDIAVDIDKVFSQKIYAMAAHKSQFFEWLPWTVGILDQVPKGDKERLDWLSQTWQGTITNDMRDSLIKWYGKDRGNKVNNAESFEICEYGRRPSDDDIHQLFPMLGK